jgi:hypothetical protein
VLQLAHVSGVGRDEDRAEPRQPEPREHGLRPVRELDDDAVARLDTEASEAGGRAE